MEMHHLRSFVAVAEEGNLSRAADRLYASQPTVSAHIKSLEEELGLSLFARTPRGMDLTPAGVQLMGRAKDVLHAVQDLNHNARRLREEISGPLSIGLNTDAEYLKIDELLAAIARTLPGVQLQLLQSTSGLILRDIHERKLDAGFAFFEIPYADVSGVDVRTSRIVLAAPNGWEESIRNLDLQDLAGLPWVMPAPMCPYRVFLDRAFAKRDVWPEQVMEADHEELIRRLVSTGKGLSLMREDEAEALQAEGKLIYRQLDDDFLVSLRFVHHREREGDPLIRRLIRLIQGIHKTEFMAEQAGAA